MNSPNEATASIGAHQSETTILILPINAILTRVGDWMPTETSHGCLFQAAMPADPGCAPLRNLLGRHKSEVGTRAAEACDLQDAATELLAIVEGLTQAWPLRCAISDYAAKRLRRLLRSGVD